MSEEKISLEIVGLDNFFLEKADAERSLERLKQEVVTLEEGLQTRIENETQKVLGLLNQGATTGDLVKDTLIRIYGLDQVRIQKIIAFADLLMQSGNKEILISTTYHRLKIANETGRQSSLVTSHIFGILSGARLELQQKEHESFIDYVLSIPFTVWVRWDDSEVPNEHTAINVGPLKIHQAGLAEPNSKSMLEAIADAESGSMNLLPPYTDWYLEQEVSSIRFGLYPNSVELIRRRLKEKVSELKKPVPT
jgi:hypothetical protein